MSKQSIEEYEKIESLNIDKFSNKVTYLSELEVPYFSEAYLEIYFAMLDANNSKHYLDLKFSTSKAYGVVKKLSPEKRKEFFIFANEIPHCSSHPQKLKRRSTEKMIQLSQTLINYMMGLKMKFDPNEYHWMFKAFATNVLFPKVEMRGDHGYTLKQCITQFNKQVIDNGADQVSEALAKKLLDSRMITRRSSYNTRLESCFITLNKIISLGESSEVSFQFNEGDVIGKYFNQKINEADTKLQKLICDLCLHSTKAKAGKPTKKWLDESKKIVSSGDSKKFKAIVADAFEYLIKSKEIEIQTNYTYLGESYTYSRFSFLNDSNNTVIKGLVWALSQFHDQATLDLLARLAERSFRKIPEVGPACGAVGNACIFTLYSSKGKVGLSHLSRLKLRIKQNNTQKLIQKYIDEAADSLGITSSALEEMAVPDFGLKNGMRVVDFDDYRIELSITAVGKTELIWYKPDGKTQKSVPAFVKQSTKHTEKLKKLRADAKQIQKYSSAQRDRIDRLYKDDREWNMEDYFSYYHDHGLVSFISRKLIWSFHIDDRFVSAIWFDGQWMDSSGSAVDIRQAKSVRLWHPLSEEDSVLAWREILEERRIVQPMKQAYREVYILTEAELNTRVYSNRMAAHLLKQHQFNALSATRGWKYSLLGCYDDGRDGEIASTKLSAHDMTAEFWINIVHDDDAFNDAGIYDYIATDQVRFLTTEGKVLPLIDVPLLVFSEVMRDVDLFVGVGSVGNDPEWQDRGGLAQFRDYWTDYSFGNLNEVAKTRKSVLERLVPRLKIKDVASIDGKFLRVKGKVREYKIHIGSSNILMEPNDQYLCIVPERKVDRKTESVFLPFEGDRGLSIVISKAFLLAEDDKITDSTILSQIK